MKKPVLYLKIAVTLILAVVILKTIGIESMVASLKTAELFPLLLALLGAPLVVMVSSRKWFEIVRHEVKGIDYRTSLISFLGGLSLGLLTPGRIGEFGKIAFVRHDRLEKLLGIALVDRVVDLEATLLLGLASSFIFWGYTSSIIFSAAVLSGALIIFYPGTFTPLLERITRVLPFKEKIASVMVGISTIPKSTLRLCFFYRFTASLIDILQFYLLLNAFTKIGLLQVIIVYPVIILMNILPLTVAGIGVREGTAILTLSSFGIPPEAAANASFLLFCVNTLLPGLIGTLFVPRLELKKQTNI